MCSVGRSLHVPVGTRAWGPAQCRCNFRSTQPLAGIDRSVRERAGPGAPAGPGGNPTPSVDGPKPAAARQSALPVRHSVAVPAAGASVPQAMVPGADRPTPQRPDGTCFARRNQPSAAEVVHLLPATVLPKPRRGEENRDALLRLRVQRVPGDVHPAGELRGARPASQREVPGMRQPKDAAARVGRPRADVEEVVKRTGLRLKHAAERLWEQVTVWEKVTGTFCAKHPEGRSGKRCLSRMALSNS